MGSSTPYLVVENKKFKEENFLKLQDTFTKQNFSDGKKNANSKASCRIAKGGNASAGSNTYKIANRGIAVHHSGLLPIIKELVELLFQEELVKALFATETFTMGLNMPAKTVVFSSVKKWDGDSHRYIGYVEYIQMSGRAGRPGKDEMGFCFIMVDDKMEMNTLKDMVLGKPAPLLSTFRLSYYSILNLMSRAEGQFTAEHVIRNSFHQCQHEKTLPEIAKKVALLEEEAAVLELKGRAACLIDTGDGLLVTELMFKGTFNDLDHHQVASLGAKKIAKIQRKCKLEINVDEYVKASVRPFLMDVIYCWSKGATFAEVVEMTDISEGSIILAARRLDEFLNQPKGAAHTGEVGLEENFAAASKSLRRGIMFANSVK
ncbi:Protein HUA ENHANCER 2 [Striga hermonthica]|uniref:Protein HUA ENHANCER 2 n=1 Tax=Striga hermonthica TaxID=68872 RepID=A0A9N7N269_STRHE|nr:Protein HUA ENHANCER 2 [Striga hermonthica]